MSWPSTICLRVVWTVRCLLSKLGDGECLPHENIPGIAPLLKLNSFVRDCKAHSHSLSRSNPTRCSPNILEIQKCHGLMCRRSSNAFHLGIGHMPFIVAGW